VRAGHTPCAVFEILSLMKGRDNDPPALLIHDSGSETYEDLAPSVPSARWFARLQAWAAICTGSQGLESGGV
jgi:hypothetical protein